MEEDASLLIRERYYALRWARWVLPVIDKQRNPSKVSGADGILSTGEELWDDYDDALDDTHTPVPSSAAAVSSKTTASRSRARNDRLGTKLFNAIKHGIKSLVGFGRSNNPGPGEVPSPLSDYSKVITADKDHGDLILQRCLGFLY